MGAYKVPRPLHVPGNSATDVVILKADVIDQDQALAREQGLSGPPQDNLDGTDAQQGGYDGQA